MFTDDLKHEQGHRRKLPAAVSYGVLTLGGIAIIAPIVLLYRANPNRIGIKRLRPTAPPPIRRPIPVAQKNPVKLLDISFRPRDVLQSYTEDEIIPDSQTPGPLHALKAFGIATCIVGVTAVISVLSIKTIFGIENTDQFAHAMRDNLKTIAPTLLSRMYREPSDADFTPIGPLRSATSRTPTSDDLGEVDPSDWLRLIEVQLEREAATEMESRLHGKRRG